MVRNLGHLIESFPNVGIEIENESNSIPRRDVANYFHTIARGAPYGDSGFVAPWEIAEEGSLRGGANGWEIRTRNNGHGMEYREAITALYTLYPLLRNSSGTWRAAVHVHVDVHSLHYKRKAIALALCYAFDSGIFNRHSPARRESNFCEPLAHKSRWVLEAIYAMARNRPFESYGRYSSVNTESMNRWGSFEFRHMQTPATTATYESVQDSITRIHRFVDDCVALVTAAKYVPIERCNTDDESIQLAMWNAASWLNKDTSLAGLMDEDALALTINAVRTDRPVDYTKVDLGSIVAASRR